MKWTINNYLVGKRVQLHPATDRWMMGDRYGLIVAVKVNTKDDATFPEVDYAKIKLDKSNKTITFNQNYYEIIN